MSFASYEDVSFTTTAGGAATVYSGVHSGRILNVIYDYDDAATGADFVITTETTQQAVITITNGGTSDVTYAPRQPVHDAAGAQYWFEAANSEAVVDYIFAAEERVKIVVAQGGATKDGVIRLIFG